MAKGAHIAGHPIHPMLVVFPIGLWIFSVVCDVVYLTHLGDTTWLRAAFYALGGGIVGALLAAIPGLIDLVHIDDAATKRIGITHMVLNLAAVAVFTIDFLIRMKRGPEADPPMIWSVLGVAVIAVSGWLGGSMVYRHGVAVDIEPTRTSR